ncbi:uncharacterized protein N7487_000007 [Penicillium crustosum]|uniref:uncharacterized protein n=1 Tax=Penicillium crustosum TaxID=36656 RepID=UPI00239A3988|nr:uncharacterized protein N7487_000007 [Penicillium crustosum]KAJ5416457.1 hypothetical protein N7487_000007 [Penicillium crustosum]
MTRCTKQNMSFGMTRPPGGFHSGLGCVMQWQALAKDKAHCAIGLVGENTDVRWVPGKKRWGHDMFRRWYLGVARLFRKD